MFKCKLLQGHILLWIHKEYDKGTDTSNQFMDSEYFYTATIITI